MISPQIRRHGHTLVELLVTMGVSSILLVGLSSAIFVAAKASDISVKGTAANAALTELTSDLQFAQLFSERTATAFTFTVPDRDGDDNPEIIRYAWSGILGDPLTKQYNAGPATTVVENIYAFQHDLPTAAPNLLSNADMELGTTDWGAIPGSTMLQESSVVRTGSKSLYDFRNSANDESGIRQDVSSQVINGVTYEIGGWVRKWAAPPPFDIQVHLHISSTGAGETYFSSAPVMINNVGWTEVKGTITPTWSGSLLFAYWELSGVSNIQEVYVDDVYMRVSQQQDQVVNISLQVGSDPYSRIESGVQLFNAPL